MESIAYWKKQLANGNYISVNESESGTKLPVHMIETLNKLLRVQKRLGSDATDEKIADKNNIIISASQEKPQKDDMKTSDYICLTIKFQISYGEKNISN